MARDSPSWLSVPAAATLLLWPAVWNGYPIVFADTGTYLSQAINHYAGWDRPVFYSLFMLPLHGTVTVWPVIVAQALLTAWLLRAVCLVLVPGLACWVFVLGVAGLAVFTWLPWLVSELMPDVFTPLLVLVLGLLWVARRRIGLVYSDSAGIRVYRASGWRAAARNIKTIPRFRRKLAIPGFRRNSGIARAGLADGGVQNKNDTRIPEETGYILLAAFMIATQQSSLPLAVVLGLALAGSRLVWPSRTVNVRAARYRPAKILTQWAPPYPSVMVGEGRPSTAFARAIKAVDGGPPPAMTRAVARSRAGAARCWAKTLKAGLRTVVLLPPLLAVLAMCSVNLLAHGRFSVSPYGNIFLLARVIEDGPGTEILRRDCPSAGWRLCRFVDRLPMASDDFLWTRDSPLNLAGGPKITSAEAGAIIKAALLADPRHIATAAIRNTARQLTWFDSGDGLKAWPDQVTPWIRRDFPAAEYVRYEAASQQAGKLSVPWPLGLIQKQRE